MSVSDRAQCFIDTCFQVFFHVFFKFFFNSLIGAETSLWSADSIAWLTHKVSGTKLLAYPSRVESSKFVIIDLYVFPPKNPKLKTPVSSVTGKGLPGLQYSIAEMMIISGMAQRIMLQVRDGSLCSGGLSPLSGGSNGCLTRSCSSVSIGSSVQEGDGLVEKCVDNVNCKEENTFTDNSCSSKETVIHTPALTNEERAKVNDESSTDETENKDVTFGQKVTDKQIDGALGLSLKERNFEHSLDQKDIKPIGK